MVVLPSWAAELHYNCSLTPPPQMEKGRKYVEKWIKDWDKDREITQQLASWAKQIQHTETNLLPITKKLEEAVRN